MVDAENSTTLARALVAAQAEMPAVEADARNPHFNSTFVSLDHLVAKTKPVLTKHGLCITQWPTHIDGAPALTTRLEHVSGEQREDTMPLLVDKNTMQGLGSAITYARRYAWAAALGICDERDDDGEGASQVAPPAAGEGAAGAAHSPAAPATDDGEYRLTFGQHKDKTIAEVPLHYAQWLATECKNEKAKQAAKDFLGQSDFGNVPAEEDIPF